MSTNCNESSKTGIVLTPGDQPVPGYVVESKIGEGACGAIYAVRSIKNDKVSRLLFGVLCNPSRLGFGRSESRTDNDGQK